MINKSYYNVISVSLHWPSYNFTVNNIQEMDL